MALDINDAWTELVNLKDSWRKRELPAQNAIILLASMLARFSLANNVPIEETCIHVNEIMRALYEDLAVPTAKA